MDNNKFITNEKGKLSCIECKSTFLYTSAKTGITVCLRCGNGRITYIEAKENPSSPLLLTFNKILNLLTKTYGIKESYGLESFMKIIMIITGAYASNSKKIGNILETMGQLEYVQSNSIGRISLTSKGMAVISGEDIKEIIKEIKEESNIDDELKQIDNLNAALSGRDSNEPDKI